ncbi:MAG: glycosyltransferase family 2 protein, partial [Arenicella sp.]|nr:glycosyltransferase family 2 protein [Arenicella sp.]
AQRAALEDLLLPPEHILLAGKTTKLPADVDYVIPLSESERLRFPALLMLKRAIRKTDERPCLIYTDHDYSASESSQEVALQPVFKPKPSPAYLYCFNYIGPAMMIARDVVENMSSIDLMSDECRYRLALECMSDVDKVLHVDEVLFVSDRREPPATPPPFETRLPWHDIQWQRGNHCNVLRASNQWSHQPSVDLIIPTRDGLSILKPCMDSILNRTDYDNFRVFIVDNGSELDETARFLAKIAEDSRVEVLQFPGEFNFSAINNFAAAHGSGEFIGLINNDIEVIDADWLRQMVVWAKQPNVGAVGAKLLFGDGRVQHAGVTIGMGNAAGHIHRLEQGDAPGYQYRCLATQNMMAVTAACMITPRDLFDRLQGLNTEQFAVAYNDIDYCLRVEQMGLDIIWTPEARLFHYESVSRGDDMSEKHIGRYFKELGNLQKLWKTKGFVDKYYSRHLRISDEGVYPQITSTNEDELLELRER